MEAMKIINEGLMKFSTRKEATGADDTWPMFIYIVIMQAPKMFYSNLNYISIYRHPAKMMDETGYCYTTANSALSYLETFDGTSAKLLPSDFEQKVLEEAKSKGISFENIQEGKIPAKVDFILIFFYQRLEFFIKNLFINQF